MDYAELCIHLVQVHKEDNRLIAGFGSGQFEVLDNFHDSLHEEGELNVDSLSMS